MAKYGELTFFDAVTQTATGTEASVVKRVQGKKFCTILAKCVSGTGTTPTLDIKPQVSDAIAVLGFSDVIVPPDITEAIAVPQFTGTWTATAATAKSITFPVTGRYMRLHVTRGGTAPVYTGLTVKGMFHD